MFVREICRILAYFFFAFSVCLLLPFFVSLYYEVSSSPLEHPQSHTTIYFLVTILISFSVGAINYCFGRLATGHLFRREGLLAVVIIWFLTPAVAALPFYLSGTLKNPFHAYFEAVSGITTTGATVMQAKKFDPETGQEVPYQLAFCGVHTTTYSYYGTIEPVRDASGAILYEGIEAVGKGLLFWRSFMQWLGGMGIIVLFVAILPALGVGGRMLFQAEMPGPVKEIITPRIKETASHLWKIYVGISFCEIFLLKWVNPKLPLFDAITITFSNISTGGFTIKNASIGAYQNVGMEWVIFFFMLLGSINFSFYYYTLRGKFYRIFEPEFIVYICLLLVTCLTTAYFISGKEKLLLTGERAGFFTPMESIRYAFFQTASCLTTTGFAVIDYDIWPYTAQVILLIVMYIGAMAGSTTGGIKVIRFLMIFRIVQYKVESLFRPETVRRFRVGALDVDSGAAVMVLSYFAIVMAMSVFSTLFYIEQGIDPETALSLATLFNNNIGIGFRMASPVESMAFLSDFGIMFSNLLMIFGRLEFLAILAIMVPAFWRQTR